MDIRGRIFLSGFPERIFWYLLSFLRRFLDFPGVIFCRGRLIPPSRFPIIFGNVAEPLGRIFWARVFSRSSHSLFSLLSHRFKARPV